MGPMHGLRFRNSIHPWAYIFVRVVDLDAGQLLLHPLCLFICGPRIIKTFLEKADAVAIVYIYKCGGVWCLMW